MKTITLSACLLFSQNLFAQNVLMFDTANINSRSKLIGKYPQYDKQKTYKHFNFIIEDSATIKETITGLRIGREGDNHFQQPHFEILLVQDNKESKSWRINPSLGSAMYDGHTYRFDVSQLEKLAVQYPFDYRLEKIAFKTKSEFENYLERQKEHQGFLFAYAPSFIWEGSFDVQFPRNKKFSSPKAISEYLKPLIAPLVGENGYSVSYFLNEKNKLDQNQFTMTLSGSRILYEQLQLENLVKGPWMPQRPTGTFYYKADFQPQAKVETWPDGRPATRKAYNKKPEKAYRLGKHIQWISVF